MTDAITEYANKNYDLLVQSRFRNAILWNLMAGRSAAEVCREIPCGASEFGKLLNLKESPTRPDGSLRDIALKIANHFKMLPDDLFPAPLYALALPDRLERTFESEAVMVSLQCAEARMLRPVNLDDVVQSRELTEKMREALSTLPPRERKVLKLRFGLDGECEHTLEDVGKIITASTERVRQLQISGFKRLQHPARRALRAFL